MNVQRDCCAPGDIIVTVVHRGFMLGRVLPERGRGPWWEYVKTLTSLRTAVRDARTLATEARTQAWFQLGTDQYQVIPLDQSPFVPE